MVGPIDRSNPSPSDDTMVAEAPTNTAKQPGATAPNDTPQPEAKSKSFDELRQEAVPVFQVLAASVGLKAPASAKKDDQVNLATTIWVKLCNSLTKAQQSADREAIQAALDAKANFISALVKAGDGRMNFGIPGVTSSGETPVSVKPPLDSNGQSVVPSVNPAVQQEVTAVLGEVRAFEDKLDKLKPEDLPQNAAAIEERAGQLLGTLKPLEQRLSEAEKNSKAMSEASAEVKKAIANLEGYIRQAQAMKNAPPAAFKTNNLPTTTPNGAPKPNGASLTPQQVQQFREKGLPAAKAASDEANALLNEFDPGKKAPSNEEAMALAERISAVLPKLTEAAQQIAPFAKQDPTSFERAAKVLAAQIEALTHVLSMLKGAPKAP